MTSRIDGRGVLCHVHRTGKRNKDRIATGMISGIHTSYDQAHGVLS